MFRQPTQKIEIAPAPEAPRKPPRRVKALWRGKQVVWFIFGIIEVLLGFRFFFKTQRCQSGGRIHEIYLWRVFSFRRAISGSVQDNESGRKRFRMDDPAGHGGLLGDRGGGFETYRYWKAGFARRSRRKDRQKRYLMEEICDMSI